MRIAIMTPTFPPYRGGMGRVAETDATQLTELGHEVHVFTTQRRTEKANEGRPFAVHELSAFPRWGQGAFVLFAWPRVRKFDLIIVNYPYFGVAEPLLLGKLLRRGGKVIVYYHMDALGTHWTRLPILVNNRDIMPKFAKLADRVLVTTIDYAESGALAQLMGTNAGLFRELPLAVDTGRFSPGPRDKDLTTKLGLEKEDRVIVHVGGLDRAHYFKGVSKLLHAMTCNELSKAKLILIGDGDLRSKYEEQAKNLGLTGRVAFAGAVSDVDLPKYLRLADVFAFPSLDKSEAFGIAALEALSCGVPVVASNLAGVRTIVRDGVNGLLTTPGSSSSLAEALGLLLSDSERRLVFSQEARKMAEEEYSEPSRLERWRVILDDLFPNWKKFS